MTREFKRADPPIPDAPGFEYLKPDPSAAATFAELATCLQQFRTWAGDPSYREMASQSGHMVVASTICSALHGRSPLRFVTVQAVIRGCGGSVQDEVEFLYAWRRIRLATGRPQ